VTDSAGTGGKKRLILVVDDFDDNREMYAEYLRFKGYEVAEAANGHDAVEIARRMLPDVVCMDLSLPGMDGWEATRRLKNDDRTRHIPIVVVTGHAFDGDGQSAMEAGGDTFLTKPCLPDELVAHVEEMMAKLDNRRSS
jgi:two-component system, cell cycle response regulator DivK